MKFNLHGHNRDTIEPGVVGTAINGTIRLQSDFEVRYSTLINSYIYLSNWYLWQLARDPRTACHWQNLARESSFFSYWLLLWYLNGWIHLSPVNHTKMIDKFGNAFVKMGNLGQKTGKVSNWWYISKLEVYHSHYYQPCLLQLTDCSVLIPQPPALNDVIQFPPGQFLTDIDQSVSSPWLT